MIVPLVKIIENLVAGDKEKAIAYADHLVKRCEEKQSPGDIWAMYDLMTARNVLHVLKGEPKEGCHVVVKDCNMLEGAKNETM